MIDFGISILLCPNLSRIVCWVSCLCFQLYFNHLLMHFFWYNWTSAVLNSLYYAHFFMFLIVFLVAVYSGFRSIWGVVEVLILSYLYHCLLLWLRNIWVLYSLLKCMKRVRGNNIYIKERKLAPWVLCEQLLPMPERSFFGMTYQQNDLEMF